MKSTEKSVNIQISEKAAAFIKSRRLVEPVILINLSSRSSQSNGSGDSCGGSGDSCCGGSGDGCGGDSSGNSSSPPVYYVNTIIIDGGQPGDDFTKVDTGARIPVYLTKKVYNIALKDKKTLIIDVKGLVMKKLVLEGLDLT